MSEYLIAHIEHSTNHSEHIILWKPNHSSYTFGLDQAGLYTETEARAICSDGRCIAFKKTEVTALTKSTPYYRRGDGSLSRLYDGGEYVVLPNTKGVWGDLMKIRLDCGKAEKPTPIGPKARAIYLPSWVQAVKND